VLLYISLRSCAVHHEGCEFWRGGYGREYSGGSRCPVGRRDRSALGPYGYGRGNLPQHVALVYGLSGTKPTSSASAAVILANSVAGLAGNGASVQNLPDALPVWAAVAAGVRRDAVGYSQVARRRYMPSVGCSSHHRRFEAHLHIRRTRNFRASANRLATFHTWQLSK